MIFLLIFGLVVFAGLALLVLLATAGVTAAALVTLASAPAQLRALLRDRRLRRNHALEHATINVIEERFGPSRLSGQANAEGFVIRGGVSPEVVAEAASEALERLRAGERRLALHPRCGATLLAAQLVLAVAILVALLVFDAFSLLPLLVGVAAAALLGPRLSPLLQRWVTTDADLGTLGVASVEVRPPASGLGLVSWLMLSPVSVRTGEPGEQGTADPGARAVPGAAEPWELSARDYRIR
ncbi:MAG TPA: DUF6391 domain-containing protein [Thermomicrobiaceae bacterium]|nr:DUF6391 domain-containing protein [Thermomicrobiaceae bacterium]